MAATSERKANEIQAFDYECGQEAWRVMVKKNNTTSASGAVRGGGA